MSKKNKTQVLLVKWRYNVANNSCGSCIESNKQILSNLTQSREESYKYSCKIIMKNPEEFEKIDPHECKYFLNKALGFF